MPPTAALDETQLTNEIPMTMPASSNDSDKITAAAATAEELRTNEDLDTEVSQINTQSNNKTQSNEPAESYSRPMSRTSSMTPVIKIQLLYSSLSLSV